MQDRTKTPEMLAAFGQAVNSLGGKYVTAEDVGMSVADMIEISKQTKFVAGLPVEGGEVGGDPGPHTSLGVFLGIKAAVKRALGKDSLAGLHIAMQGAGSVAGGVAAMRRPRARSCRLPTSTRRGRRSLPRRPAAPSSSPDDILSLEADVVSPCALGAILTEESDRRASTRRSSRAAPTTSLRRRKTAQRLQARGILYAPDYVINAGGIINVSTEYLGDGGPDLVRSRIEAIPGRLEQIWAESAATGRDPAAVADAMAQKLIGRG